MMSERDDRELYEDIVDAICAWHPEARSSQVFGREAFAYEALIQDHDVHARCVNQQPRSRSR